MYLIQQYLNFKHLNKIQNLLFLLFRATFVMALVITINYSRSSLNQTKDTIKLQATKKKPLHIEYSKTIKVKSIMNSMLNPPNLSENEFRVVLNAGNAAIAARKIADLKLKPLKILSPSIRHQVAVGTSATADLLALQGTAEIAATREIEKIRYYIKKPSSLGILLKINWVKNHVCTDYYKIFCNNIHIRKYRQIDGACNHPQHLGMAFTPFKRILPPDYGDGINTPRRGKFDNPLPSAHEISLKVKYTCITIFFIFIRYRLEMTSKIKF